MMLVLQVVAYIVFLLGHSHVMFLFFDHCHLIIPDTDFFPFFGHCHLINFFW